MACLLSLTRTHSWVPMISFMKLLWSNFCLYIFMLLFSFSIFSDRQSLKIENEINNIKTLTAEAPYIGLHFINKETYPGWLELPLTGSNFHGPKPARATEVLL